MVKMDQTHSPRINGSMLQDYEGGNVCVLGMAKNVDSNGTSFILTTSDNTDIKVVMEEPLVNASPPKLLNGILQNLLNEYVSDLTEVQGRVQGKTIHCLNYISFPQEVSQTFDMSMYNTAVEFMARAPQFYQQGMKKP